MRDCFRITSWVVDPRINTVSRNGTTVRLEPKVMEVLVCLARHGGEPVSKEELLQTVWPNTFVTDDGLKRSISELRRLFEDDVREPHVIQTIPKRGYRLMVPVEPAHSAQITPMAESIHYLPKAVDNGRKLGFFGFAVAVLLLMTAGALYLGQRQPWKTTDPAFATPIQSSRGSRPPNSKAFDAYLQGNYHLARAEWSVAEEEKRSAAQYFQQAIDADSDFASAYIGLANAHSELALGSREDLEVAKRAAEKALQLDPNAAEAWDILGHIKWIELDWAGAEQDMRRVIALRPNRSSCVCELGILLAATGRLDEGWREAEIEQELNPNENDLSSLLEMRGEHDRAINILKRMAVLHPTDSSNHYDLFRNYAETGRQKEAIQELERELTLKGAPDMAAAVHRGFATAGYKGAMREYANAMEAMQRVGLGFFPEGLATAYTALGDHDRAFYWLEQAYQQREKVSLDWGLMILKEDRMLDPLRSDLRFKDLLRRVGLPSDN